MGQMRREGRVREQVLCKERKKSEAGGVRGMDGGEWSEEKGSEKEERSERKRRGSRGEGGELMRGGSK